MEGRCVLVDDLICEVQQCIKLLRKGCSVVELERLSLKVRIECICQPLSRSECVIKSQLPAVKTKEVSCTTSNTNDTILFIDNEEGEC